MIKTYKFKLYQAKKNKSLHQQIDISGIIWNHCIALERRYYHLTGKHLNQFELMKHIAKLKHRPRYAYWKLVGSDAIQDIIKRIERSYVLFFRNLKAGIKASPPGFKKIKKYNSFTFNRTNWKLLDSNRIIIRGKLYKYSKSRSIPTDIKLLTVKRDNLGHLWLCFVVFTPDNQDSKVMTGNSAGFDFGLKAFLTLDDGSIIESPLYYRQAMIELGLAQRNLSRKVKFSHGWQKAKLAVARIYRQITNKRRDFFYKLAHKLTNRYDYLYFEDLNVKGMHKLWGRKMGDIARSEFMGILKRVANAKGKVVQLIDRWYPSSKTCSDCGWLYKDLRLAERHWTCANCGSIHDRDKNAAINIRREGASSLGLGEVRPKLVAFAV